MTKAIDARSDGAATFGRRAVQIDFYQRDYKWQSKQVEELVTDLTSSFLSITTSLMFEMKSPPIPHIS